MKNKYILTSWENDVGESCFLNADLKLLYQQFLSFMNTTKRSWHSYSVCARIGVNLSRFLKERFC